MPLYYNYMFFVGKFYADMGINVYFLLASIYGCIRWRKATHDESAEISVFSTPIRYGWRLTLVGLALFVLIACVFECFTDSAVSYGDAFTTALSIVAMWMLAHRYIEQWWLWFVVNAVSAGLYFWKDLTITGILFSVYAIVSIFGYLQWRKKYLVQRVIDR